MSRITLDTKCRLCRSAGTKLYLKGTRCYSAKCPIERKGAVKPGMHGVKSGSKLTDYGIQLRAKQKAKRIYGVQENQFKNYYLQAKGLKGLVGENLLALLEKRLDNIIFLSGLALSRSSAKQLISHGHILINDKVLNIPSYQVKIKDVVTLDKKIATKIGTLPSEESDFKAPGWLDLNKQKLSVKIISEPLKQEIGNDIDINLIIEYYSR
jgi:small subunit ribosomal protein S4